MSIKNRTDIINHLIEYNGYSRYLEIGVRHGNNFREIKIDHKDSVDPAPKCDCSYPMTSDDFFKNTKPAQKYDIIFIDGLHIKEQVIRDVNNSLDRLNDGGVIVMHDCNPKNPEHATEKYNGGIWNGTVWEAFVEFRFTSSDLCMCVVDVDHGCGIIRRGAQDTLDRPTKMSFDFFQQNRMKLLNLISAGDFEKHLCRCP